MYRPRRSDSSARQLLGAVLLLGLAGCGGTAGEETPAPPFRVVGCDQQGAEAVRLNEPIRIRFSGLVDPGSVREGTLDIARIGPDGVPLPGKRVAGELRIGGRGDEVRFLPRVPVQADLRDGGLEPGGRYRVRVGGFPRPDAIRSLDGRLLEAGARFEFRVVGPGRKSELFEPIETWPGDTLPRIPRILQDLTDLHQIQFAADAESWLFVFDSPLRPDHLDPRAIRLVQPRADSGFLFSQPPERWPADALIPVNLRLLRASEARSRLDEVLLSPLTTQVLDPAYLVDGCVLEVRPQFASPPEPRTLFLLWIQRDRSPEGIEPLVAYSGEPLPEGSNFLVVELQEVPGRSRTLSFDFLPGEGLAPEDQVLGLAPADGVLRTWEGVARAALPAEVGGGEDGQADLVRTPQLGTRGVSENGESGWNFTRLDQAPHFVTELVEGDRHRVRTQGRLLLGGTLRAAPPAGESPTAALTNAPLEEGLEPVLAWLEDNAVPHLALLAGGQLAIQGEIDVPGRVLVLASSNLLVVEARARLRAESVWCFVPEHPDGSEGAFSWRGSATGASGSLEPVVRGGRYDWVRAPRVAAPLVFRVVSQPAPFDDLQRVFGPQVLAHLQLARGLETGVRSFVQVGNLQGAGWAGAARYLVPEVPFDLEVRRFARVGLEIELFPALPGEERSALPEVDRLDVVLR